MFAIIDYKDKKYETNLSAPVDISIPIGRKTGPNAFYLSGPDYKTVEAGDFIGNVARGGSCNCEDIRFNPHGNGTHTEGAGHISAEDHFINDVLKRFLFVADLITVPVSADVIDLTSLEAKIEASNAPEALIVRTSPNSPEKKNAQYSGTMPPYFSVESIDFINSLGIKHILTDLPSLDNEDDEKLLAHHRFFTKGESYDLSKTVTEMIFVPDQILDGRYLLNLQIASFESDASPSKPVLYALRMVNQAIG